MFGFLFRKQRLLTATQEFLASKHDVHFGPNGLAQLEAICARLAPQKANRVDASLAMLSKMITDPDDFGLTLEATRRLIGIVDRLEGDASLSDVRKGAQAAVALADQRLNGLSEWNK